jgi:hypothetical protein
MRILLLAVSFGCIGSAMISCSNSSTPPPHPVFTKADSLTDYYLSLQDSLHLVWNVMMNSENQKIDAMHSLIHEMIITHPDELDQLKVLEERLEQLMRMRYTQKSIANEDVIAEYDFAADALISELTATVQAKKEYSYNRTLQKLVSTIEHSDEKVLFFRNEYDSIVRVFNTFIEKNKGALIQADDSLMLEKKPFFHMVSGE